MPAIGLLLADDHLAVRQAMHQYLEQSDDFIVLTRASSVRQAVQKTRAQHPQVALPTDIYPPPTPVATGINISSLSGGCPNSVGLESLNQVSVETILTVLNQFNSSDMNVKRLALSDTPTDKLGY